MTTTSLIAHLPLATTLIPGLESISRDNPLGIAIGVAVFEALVIVVLVGRILSLRRRLRASGEESAERSTQAELASLYDKALTGSLDRFAINEVIQFINSIQETGILDIVDERISSVHRLLVDNGEIMDAFNGDTRGEEALHQILQCREGSFTFIRGDLPSGERSIHKPTMTLLMENMQLFDEAGGAPAPP